MAYDEVALIICDIVSAELVPRFDKRSMLDSTLATINIYVSSMDKDVAFLAGENGQYTENRVEKENESLPFFS